MISSYNLNLLVPPHCRRLGHELNNLGFFHSLSDGKRLAAIIRPGQEKKGKVDTRPKVEGKGEAFRGLKILDLTSGRESLSVRLDDIDRVVWSPDGLHLAVVIAPKEVQPGNPGPMPINPGGDKAFRGFKVWELTTGKEVLTVPEKNLDSLAWSSNNKRLAGGILPKQVKEGEKISEPMAEANRELFRGFKVWDVPTRKEVVTVRQNSFNGLVWAPDGEHLAASLTQVVKVWDANTGGEVSLLPADSTGHGLEFVFSPDGKQLAMGHQQGNFVRVWNWKSSRRVINIPLLNGLDQLAYTQNGRFLVAFNGLSVDRFDLRTVPGGVFIEGNGEGINALTFSPDNRHLATGGNDGFIRIYDATTGAEVKTFLHSPETYAVTAIAYNQDGSRLATAGYDGVITIWDWTTGKPLSSVHRLGLSIYKIAFSPDGRLLASASARGIVTIWDVANGQDLPEVEKHRFPTMSLCLAFSPSGKRLASTTVSTRSGDKLYPPEIKVWDLTTGKKVFALALEGTVTSITFSADESRMILLGDNKDKTLEIRNALTGELLSSCATDKYSRFLSLSPDGKRFAATGIGSDVEIVDSATGQTVLILHNEEVLGNSEITSLVFSPDGQRLATSNMKGTIMIWNGSPRKENPAPPP